MLRLLSGYLRAVGSHLLRDWKYSRYAPTRYVVDCHFQPQGNVCAVEGNVTGAVRPRVGLKVRSLTRGHSRRPVYALAIRCKISGPSALS